MPRASTCACGCRRASMPSRSKRAPCCRASSPAAPATRRYRRSARPQCPRFISTNRFCGGWSRLSRILSTAPRCVGVDRRFARRGVALSKSAIQVTRRRTWRKVRSAALAGLSEGLAALLAMRGTEGAALSQILSQRLSRLTLLRQAAEDCPARKTRGSACAAGGFDCAHHRTKQA